MNDQNLVVDFHPLTGDNQDPIANHKIIRGEIAQALITGNAAVVIRAGGKEQIFPISPQVRSKVAAIPVWHSAIFLTDEIDQVADVTFKSPDSARASEWNGGDAAGRQPKQNDRSHRGRTEKTFEVRELSQKKMDNLTKGDMVVLLIDGDKKSSMLQSRHASIIANDSFSAGGRAREEAGKGLLTDD